MNTEIKVGSLAFDIGKTIAKSAWDILKRRAQNASFSIQNGYEDEDSRIDAAKVDENQTSDEAVFKADSKDESAR